jgi:hypothetical protein
MSGFDGAGRKRVVVYIRVALNLNRRKRSGTMPLVKRHFTSRPLAFPCRKRVAAQCERHFAIAHS